MRDAESASQPLLIATEKQQPKRVVFWALVIIVSVGVFSDLSFGHLFSKSSAKSSDEIKISHTNEIISSTDPEKSLGAATALAAAQYATILNNMQNNQGIYSTATSVVLSFWCAEDTQIGHVSIFYPTPGGGQYGSFWPPGRVVKTSAINSFPTFAEDCDANHEGKSPDAFMIITGMEIVQTNNMQAVFTAQQTKKFATSTENCSTFVANCLKAADYDPIEGSNWAGGALTGTRIHQWRPTFIFKALKKMSEANKLDLEYVVNPTPMNDELDLDKAFLQYRFWSAEGKAVKEYSWSKFWDFYRGRKVFNSETQSNE